MGARGLPGGAGRSPRGGGGAAPANARGREATRRPAARRAACDATGGSRTEVSDTGGNPYACARPVAPRSDRLYYRSLLVKTSGFSGFLCSVEGLVVSSGAEGALQATESRRSSRERDVHAGPELLLYD